MQEHKLHQRGLTDILYNWMEVYSHSIATGAVSVVASMMCLIAGSILGCNIHNSLWLLEAVCPSKSEKSKLSNQNTHRYFCHKHAAVQASGVQCCMLLEGLGSGNIPSHMYMSKCPWKRHRESQIVCDAALNLYLFYRQLENFAD